MLHSEFYLLPLNESAEVIALDSRKVHEHILAALIRRNKAEAFFCVKPFNRAEHVIRHKFSLL